MIERRLKMNTTLPGPGEARTGEAVRRVFEATLADDTKKTEFLDALADALAAAAGEAELREALLRLIPESRLPRDMGEEAAEKVATGYRLELVAGNARSLWLGAETEEWQLENPTDAIQAFVQAAFCCPGQELVIRHRSDASIELIVRKASSSHP
jgi:hypothetical protein